MEIIPIRPKRCSVCKKIININNKSGFCQHHAQIHKNKEKKLKFCHICEEPCCGKLRIEYRKGSIVSFCTYHFNKLNLIRDSKVLRAEIKRLKGL